MADHSASRWIVDEAIDCLSDVVNVITGVLDVVAHGALGAVTYKQAKKQFPQFPRHVLRRVCYQATRRVRNYGNVRISCTR